MKAHQKIKYLLYYDRYKTACNCKSCHNCYNDSVSTSEKGFLKLYDPEFEEYYHENVNAEFSNSRRNKRCLYGKNKNRVNYAYPNRNGWRKFSRALTYFLHGKVNLYWDDVYSELVRKFSKRPYNKLDYDFNTWINWKVEFFRFHTGLNEWICISDYGDFRERSHRDYSYPEYIKKSYYKNTFYVDPIDGIFKLVPYQKYVKAKESNPVWDELVQVRKSTDELKFIVDSLLLLINRTTRLFEFCKSLYKELEYRIRNKNEKSNRLLRKFENVTLYNFLYQLTNDSFYRTKVASYFKGLQPINEYYFITFKT